MTDPAAEAAEERDPEKARDEDGEDAGQIRGSSLLLVGRFIAIALAFAAQALTVRYLSRTDYGVFAYGMSLATLGESVALVGFDRAVTRFLPIYDEEGRREHALGLIVTVAATIVGVGTAFVVLLAALAPRLVGPLDAGPGATTVLVLLGILGPLLGLDRLGTSLLAVWSNPQAIFLRKYVLGPGLRLVAVLAVIGVGADVRGMAVAYVIAGVLGVVVYVTILVQTIRAGAHLRGTSLRSARFAAGAILSFSLPLLTTDLVFATIESVDGIMVGALAGADQVAPLRAVQPVARLTQVAMTSFGVLFTPLAARYFSRGDHDRLGSLYWMTAMWVTVLSFPLFAVAFGLAQPISVLLFGAEYRDAGAVLSLLALGYYATATAGFNGMVLNVYGLVRKLVVLNLVAATMNIVINLALIPSAGAVGAATATAVTFIIHNLMKQRVLHADAGVTGMTPVIRRAYLTVAVGAAALVPVAIITPPWPIALLVVGSTSIAVLARCRSALDVASVFPAVGRYPLIGRLLSGGDR